MQRMSDEIKMEDDVVKMISDETSEESTEVTMSNNNQYNLPPDEVMHPDTTPTTPHLNPLTLTCSTGNNVTLCVMTSIV